MTPTTGSAASTPTETASGLPTRRLGSGLEVSAIGFGAMGMSEFYGPADDAQSLRTLHAAVDAGVGLIDTADIYGRGHNETLVGRLLDERRDAVAAGTLKVATKCGIDRPADASYARRINNAPDYIRACCEASLRRLGVERIDLYYVHRVDPDADIAETMGALADLAAEGKIAHAGLCEVSARTLEAAHAVHPVAALQTEYSLWTRDVEAEILPTVRRLGVGFVAYSPLGRGFLTGALTDPGMLADGDFRRGNPRFQGENLTHNLSLLETVQTVAEAHGATPAQVALAWLLARDRSIVPIPGTRRTSRLHENLGALGVRLSEADMSALDAAFAPGAPRGERYGAEGMKGINA